MKNNQNFNNKLAKYRYEFLLVSLLLLIFDKIFFPVNEFYIKYVWPINMILMSIASFGVFIEHNKNVKTARNFLVIISLLMPIGFLFLSHYYWFVHFLTLFFIVYYGFIFAEVMFQITMTKEV